MILFTNPGEIDPRAITVLGASSKPNSTNPIGFFGTGLKYAIAVILRNGGLIEITSGSKTYKFSTKPVKIRADEFQIVCMNDEELGFTTELGKNWEPWMAYRELYCNALDEGGSVEKDFTPIDPSTTVISVHGCDFEEIHKNRHEFVIDKSRTPLWANDSLEIYNGKTNGIFYRGIRVQKGTNPKYFTYNITSKIQLTEDRTAANDYECRCAIRDGLTDCSNARILQTVLTRDSLYYEGGLTYSGYVIPGEAFINVVLDMAKTNIGKLLPSAYELVTNHLREREGPEIKNMSRVEEQMLTKALDFAYRLEPGLRKWTVIPVTSLGGDILGMAKDEKIYISSRAFAMGTKMLAGTILEEGYHLEHKYADETREFQNYLIDKIVSLGEEHILMEPL